MSKIKEINKFKKLAKILDTILKIGYWVSIIGVLSVIIRILLINFNPNIIDLTANYNFGFGNVGLDVNTTILGVQNIIKATTLYLIQALIVLAVIIYLVYQLRKILKNVLNESPFNTVCVSHMKKLGYGVIISGLVFNTISGITDYLVIQLLNIEKLLRSADYIKNVRVVITPINVTIIIVGLLILLLAAIFQYGTYLQEEYDSTL